MKKFGRRLAALGLALTLAVAGAGQAAYASWALGEELTDRTVTLAQGATLTTQKLWSASKSDLRTEHYVTYTPGGPVKPVIFSGTYVASTNTVSAAAAQWEAQGYRVAAAVNGGFFNTDGTIVGMLVTDGVVRSLDVDNYTMLGFTNDGRVFIDESRPTAAISWLRADGTPFAYPMTGFNAYRNASYLSGLYLYNKDFSSRVTSGGANVSAILRPLGEDGLKMNGTLALEVVSVTDATQEGVAFDGNIPEGCYMLYAEDREDPALVEELRRLAPGGQVTVALGGASEQWADAAYGVSGLHTILRDAEIVSGLPTSPNPYTAVGVKPDGSAVFYTIDGRQSGYSIGATYAQVAQRLQELGCVTAVALDGGGSTTMGATLPGGNDFSIVNRPSTDGRRINNTILLVGPETGATGVPAGAYVTADRQVVLTGAELTVSAQPYDTAGYPMADRVPVWTATGGIVQPGEDFATASYSCVIPGEFSISAADGGEGAMGVRVVNELTALSVRREDSAGVLDELRLEPGGQADLTASGSWWGLPVAMDDGDVKWSADPAVGVIDETGRFTAVQDNAEGNITATVGGKTVTIPVSVERGDPFTDMAGHWSAPYVTRLYKLGLTSGYELEDGTFVFRPDGKLTRGELLTFITRLLGVDPDLYQNVELPFADRDGIADWLLPYVKAMYALNVFQGSENGGALYADVYSNVTREAAMTMLGRVLAESRSADLSGFADAGAVSDWARPHVETLVGLGIVEGGDGLLTPKADITRGAAAKLLVEIYELDKAELTPGQEEDPAGQPSVDPGVGDPSAQPSQPGGATYVDPLEVLDLPKGEEWSGGNPAIDNPWDWNVFD